MDQQHDANENSIEEGEIVDDSEENRSEETTKLSSQEDNLETQVVPIEHVENVAKEPRDNEPQEDWFSMRQFETGRQNLNQSSNVTDILTNNNDTPMNSADADKRLLEDEESMIKNWISRVMKIDEELSRPTNNSKSKEKTNLIEQVIGHCNYPGVNNSLNETVEKLLVNLEVYQKNDAESSKNTVAKGRKRNNAKEKQSTIKPADKSEEEALPNLSEQINNVNETKNTVATPSSQKKRRRCVRKKKTTENVGVSMGSGEEGENLNSSTENDLSEGGNEEIWKILNKIEDPRIRKKLEKYFVNDSSKQERRQCVNTVENDSTYRQRQVNGLNLQHNCNHTMSNYGQQPMHTAQLSPGGFQNMNNSFNYANGPYMQPREIAPQLHNCHHFFDQRIPNLDPNVNCINYFWRAPRTFGNLQNRYISPNMYHFMNEPTPQFGTNFDNGSGMFYRR